MDKITEALLAALKLALSEPGEQRLVKSGKLTGLFPGRTGAQGDAAARALNDGLLEVVRTETRGKTRVEWVRPTPKGVNFLHEHESPVQLLRELEGMLQTTRAGGPLWLADLRLELQNQGNRIAELMQRYLQHLEGLSQRVEETLRRVEAAPAKSDASAPWAGAAIGYLDRRRATGAADDCPLPELFAALREEHAELSLPAFHDGLRRLHDRRALRLVPADPSQPLPEPEHALVDGAGVYYFARRNF